MKQISIQVPSSDIRNLELVLDFVERWNKYDRELDVAQAAHSLEGLLVSLKLEAQEAQNV